jgi:hypothetical protein
MEVRKRMRAEEDATNGRSDDSKHRNARAYKLAKWNDCKRENEEGGVRVDALPDEMLEAVLLANYTRGANSSAAAALVPLRFVCRRWNAIVRPHASNGARVMD